MPNDYADIASTMNWRLDTNGYKQQNAQFTIINPYH